MSIEVKDLENPDDVELAYIAQRPWMITEAENSGLNMEKSRAYLEGREPRDITVVTTDDMRLGNAAPAGAPRQNIQEEPPEPERMSADGDDEVDDDYESWTKADLEAEIDDRNAERPDDQKISKSGTKAEMAARLHEDDAA